jgi:hypothetical protein
VLLGVLDIRISILSCGIWKDGEGFVLMDEVLSRTWKDLSGSSRWYLTYT